MLLFIEILVILLFQNFKLILYQYCDLFTSHWFYYTISMLIKEFTFLIYPSMPIVNITWQARVGIFNSSNHCSKQKQKNIGMLHFLLHHTVYP